MTNTMKFQEAKELLLDTNLNSHSENILYGLHYMTTHNSLNMYDFDYKGEGMGCLVDDNMKIKKVLSFQEVNLILYKEDWY